MIKERWPWKFHEMNSQLMSTILCETYFENLAKYEEK
jgi:hypothetical protein